ncbi:hypothetical protein [Paractinoplanes deccanensis]|nr:hypothetical protein [Actinoplanes deccanensis]
MKIGSITGTAIVLASAVALSGCGGNGDSDAKDSPAAASSTSTGNGVEALTGQEILDKARAALKDAKSYHVAGSMVEEGDKTTIDLKIAGEDVVGHVTTKDGKIELLAVGQQRFFRPDPAFWTAQGAEGKTVAKAIGDRWVKVDPSDTSSADMFSITNIEDALKNEGTVAKGETKQVDGKKAIALTDSADGKDGGVLYVATEGEPYPLRLDGPTAADGSLAFTEYGETFADLKVPAAADVVDLKDLGK